MSKLVSMTLEEIYLDWVNNWLTVVRMAEYYEVPPEYLENLLTAIVDMRLAIYA